MRARSHRRRSGKSHRWLFVLIVLGVAVVVLMLLAPMLAMNWLRGYLRQEAFRGKMEQLLGTHMRGTVDLSPLRWSGDDVSAVETRATLANGWRADLDALHLALDWNAFRRGTWRIVGAGADDLSLRYETPPSDAGSITHRLQSEDAGGRLPSQAEAADSTPLWIRRWLPTRTEIDGVRVDRFSVQHPGMGNGGWLLRGARLRIAPWQEETAIQANIEGGAVELPIRLPGRPSPLSLDLSRASVRLSRDRLSLSEATLHWMEPSELTVRGHVDFASGGYEISTHLAGIPVPECVTDDWRMRLSGHLGGDLQARGQRGIAPITEGDLQLRNGVLTALPILDQLASYTGVERFKRLVLDIATTHFRSVGDTHHFDKIVLQSNGLLRIEGSLSIRQRQLEGSFLVGVTPETLRWIPGAQQHVFTLTNPNGPAGMLWTSLIITGPIEAPREDLSQRLLAGAGRAVLDASGQIVGKGTELLLSPVVGQEKGAMPGEVIKGATDAVGKGVESGVKVLEGLRSGLLGK